MVLNNPGKVTLENYIPGDIIKKHADQDGIQCVWKEINPIDNNLLDGTKTLSATE